MLTDTIFQVGELVVHPTYGFRRIHAIEEPGVRNGAEANYVFLIGSSQNRIKVSVPVEKAQAAGLRRPITRQQAGDVLRILRSPARTPSEHSNDHIEELSACLNHGDLLGIAAAVKNLTATGLKAKGGRADRGFVNYRCRGQSLLAQAIERLVEELSFVQGVSRKQVKQRIEKYLKKLSPAPIEGKRN